MMPELNEEEIAKLGKEWIGEILHEWQEEIGKPQEDAKLSRDADAKKIELLESRIAELEKPKSDKSFDQSSLDKALELIAAAIAKPSPPVNVTIAEGAVKVEPKIVMPKGEPREVEIVRDADGNAIGMKTKG